MCKLALVIKPLLNIQSRKLPLSISGKNSFPLNKGKGVVGVAETMLHGIYVEWYLFSYHRARTVKFWGVFSAQNSVLHKAGSVECHLSHNFIFLLISEELHKFVPCVICKPFCEDTF